VADVYLGLDQLQEAAAELRGFPSHSADVREVTFGALDSKAPFGRYVGMRFYCLDMAGHAYVHATVQTDHPETGKVQSTVLSLPVEAGTLDSFVEELGQAGIRGAGRAYLKGLA
jgi:hypothetical protein